MCLCVCSKVPFQGNVRFYKLCKYFSPPPLIPSATNLMEYFIQNFSPEMGSMWCEHYSHALLLQLSRFLSYIFIYFIFLISQTYLLCTFSKTINHPNKIA